MNSVLILACNKCMASIHEMPEEYDQCHRHLIKKNNKNRRLSCRHAQCNAQHAGDAFDMSVPDKQPTLRRPEMKTIAKQSVIALLSIAMFGGCATPNGSD